jgi:hypothetical protein
MELSGPAVRLAAAPLRRRSDHVGGRRRRLVGGRGERCCPCKGTAFTFESAAHWQARSLLHLFSECRDQLAADETPECRLKQVLAWGDDYLPAARLALHGAARP